MKIIHGMSLLLFASIVGSAIGSAATSSFNEVKSVLKDEKFIASTPSEKKIQDQYHMGQAHLPHYAVTDDIVGKFLAAATRTLNNSDDYHPPFTKVVHPNGICLTGLWEMTEDSAYTGYFAKGKKGLFVGRASTAMNATEKGDHRPFGFAGKIFPTMNPEESVSTGNFFTVDVLLGEQTDHFADTSLTNEPELGLGDNFLRIGALILGNTIGEAFKEADAARTPSIVPNPMFRPLYPVSQLGLRPGEAVRTPHWIKISTDTTHDKAVDEADFRNELNLRLHPRAQGIRLEVAVSDTTKDRDGDNGWQKIGHIQLTESFVSSGCDRQLHFPHPAQTSN